jgi:23S rRNA (uracil1939-C5)-methyltransferase
MPKKNKPIKSVPVSFSGIADRGKAVGRTLKGEVVFATGPVPGDTAEVKLIKKRKGVWVGVVDKYLEKSQHRVEPFCSHFEDCGGCKWQHLDYQKQLEEKETVVRDAFRRIAKVEPVEFLPIAGGDQTSYYRNKLEFSFSNKRWLTNREIMENEGSPDEDVLGFHAPGSFARIVPIEQCHLQPDPSNAIRNFVRDYTLQNNYSYWDAKANTGLMRNMVIRTSSTGETMLAIVFSNYERTKVTALLDAVLAGFPGITSLFYVINQKLNDSLADQEFILYHGKDHIVEEMGPVRFKISPKSFFQTNTAQSRKLYDIALDFADFKGNELVYDLYTGIGSIALYLARKVRRVIGIEIIEEAIQDARENARINQIENARFHTGDVKDVLTPEFERPDVVMIDPPRAGMHRELVETLLKLAPRKLVYISCNPATQARDVALLAHDFDLLKVQPVDMFPHTHHIESVALLHRKNSGLVH